MNLLFGHRSQIVVFIGRYGNFAVVIAGYFHFDFLQTAVSIVSEPFVVLVDIRFDFDYSARYVPEFRPDNTPVVRSGLAHPSTDYPARKVVYVGHGFQLIGIQIGQGLDEPLPIVVVIDRRQPLIRAVAESSGFLPRFKSPNGRRIGLADSYYDFQSYIFLLKLHSDNLSWARNCLKI